jgi:hypothetical protein
MYRRYGNWPDAVAAYNWGPGNMDAWIGGGRAVAKFPLEIERYRNRVLREAAFAEPGITKASGWPLGGGPPPVSANAVSEPPRLHNPRPNTSARPSQPTSETDAQLIRP